HLMDRRDAEGDGEARGLQLQLLDVVLGQGGGEPRLGDLSGLRGGPAGGRPRSRCPSTRGSPNGRSLTPSSSASVGRVRSRQPDSSQPCRYTGPCLDVATDRATSSSPVAEVADPSSGAWWCPPVPVRWTCVSTNPGRIVVPGRSTVRSASGTSPTPTRSMWAPSTGTP